MNILRVAATSICILFSILSINDIKDPDLDFASETFATLNKSSDEAYRIFEMYNQRVDDRGVQERLDAFAVFLNNNSNFNAYIISYGGRRSCRGEAIRRAKLAVAYLIGKRKIRRDRITIIDGGYREEWVVQLWDAPVTATDTAPISGTIDKDRVQIIRRCHR